MIFVKWLFSLCIYLFPFQFLMGQVNQTSIEEQFETYQQIDYKEKVFVHTDKDFYVAGEIIWFKIYLVDGHFHKPGIISKVAYVEIIGSDQKPLMQAKIDLSGSKGTGSFLLPSTVNSGKYTFRAYTKWMKNDDPVFFFRKSISIVNTFKKPDWEKINKTISPDIQFFPESGNLVYGLRSQVAFQSVGANGNAVACSGVIVNNLNDTITFFQSSHMGMGRFDFTPKIDETYYAIIDIGGEKNKRKLPDIQTTGLVMNVKQEGDTHFILNLAATKAFWDKSIYLLASTRQSLHKVITSKIENGHAQIRIDKAWLGDGISVFTILGENQQPLCERLVFKYPVNSLQVKANPDNNFYNKKEKITVNIKSTNSNEQAFSANFSLSVFLLDSLQQPGDQNIDHYFLLQSDLAGKIENLSFYFDRNNNDAALAMDNLMLTQGWRRFRWDDIFQNKRKVADFLPEYEGQLISATVFDQQTRRPAANVPVYISLPGVKYGFNITNSDANGRIHAVTGKYFDKNGIIFQTIHDGYTINIDEFFSDKYIPDLNETLKLSKEFENVLEEKSIAIQSQYAYLSERLTALSIPEHEDSMSFYGVPDKKYFLDDYTRFSSMEEVLREFVPEVRVRKNINEFHFQVKNTPAKLYFDNDPLVLVDGIPVNITSLMNYDPFKLQKIEIVARKYFLHNHSYEGIVSFFTYEGFPEGLDLGKNSFRKAFENLQPYREFYSPIYDDQQQKNKLPDLRNVLFWEPNINTNNNGEAKVSFYTSEIPGKYAIVIQGLGADGISGGSLSTFTVQEK